MNKLNEMFEKDQTQSIDKTKDVNKLSDQVLKLQSLENEIKGDEEVLKNKKKSAAMLSEEIIPTMMTEVFIFYKISRRFRCRSETRLRCFYSCFKKGRSI